MNVPDLYHEAKRVLARFPPGQVDARDLAHEGWLRTQTASRTPTRARARNAMIEFARRELGLVRTQKDGVRSRVCVRQK